MSYIKGPTPKAYPYLAGTYDYSQQGEWQAMLKDREQLLNTGSKVFLSVTVGDVTDTTTRLYTREVVR